MRVTRFPSLVVSAILLVAPPFALPQLLTAQNITGTILGAVTDTSGGSIPGAEVTVTNQQTNELAKSTTSQLGYYVVPYLKPGVYRIEITKVGFQTVRREEINVQDDSRLDFDFRRQVHRGKCPRVPTCPESRILKGF